MAQELIGLSDASGVLIREGDIVEYIVSYDYAEVPTYDGPGGTQMVDTVKVIDGTAYFWDEGHGGGLAQRHHEHCRVIGSIYDPVQEPASM